MYGPPKLTPSDLPDLACRVGGARQAARLLGVTSVTLLEWERTEGAPLMALRLLWYAGPDGRAEALLDTENELRAVAAERDAAVEELQRRRGLIDERTASLAAKVKALEHENSELRRLLNATELAAELEAVRTSMDRLLRKVAGPRVVEVP